jgi:hypothetical protein
MSAPGVLRDQDDNFKELLIDRINIKLQELSGDDLMSLIVYLVRLHDML